MDAYSFSLEMNINEEIIEASANWGVPLPFFDISDDDCDLAYCDDEDPFSRL